MKATHSRKLPVILLLGLAIAVVATFALVLRPAIFEPRWQRLVRQLQTAEQAEDRAEAAKALGRMRAAARPAAPALVQALRDDGRYLTRGFLIPKENYVKSDAAAALKNIGGLETAEAIVAVMPAFTRGDGSWDWHSPGLALDVVAHLGKQARPVACRLLEGIDQVNQGEVVNHALRALEAMEISPGTPEEIAAAKKVLPQFFRYPGGQGIKAAQLLHRMAPDDDEVLEMYIQAVARANPPAQPGAVELNSRSIPLLIRHLADQPNQGAIAQLGVGELAAVLPSLKEALRDPNPRVRAGAATALANRGAAAAEVAPEIAPLLANEDPSVQVAVAAALWRISQQAETTFPVLVAALESNDPAARDAARAFVSQLGPHDQWASSALAKIAASESGKTTSLEALRVLERIGPAAAEALPTILELLKAEDPDIQRAAAKALAAIDAK